MAATLAITAAAHACNVPVFRYALERWRPDPYRITLLHRDPLSEAERALISPLKEPSDKSPANFVFRSIAVNELDDAADRALLASLDKPELPWLIVQYPAPLRIDAPLWAGSLSREAVARLVDSPARQELVRRLVEGQTAVWLFVESGNKEKDNSAAALVEEQLKKLVKELKLPVLTDAPADNLQAGPPLKIAFSVLRIPRGEAAEQALIAMLVGSESDLAERTDPLVFPVFGRGRALFPLVGAGITADNIHDSAAFLVGACSCEVKEQNPGLDLLLTADWDLLLSPDGVSLPVIASTGPPSSEAELVAIPSGSQSKLVTTPASTASPAPLYSYGINHLVFVVGGGALVCGLAIVMLVVALFPRGQTAPRQGS